MIIAEFFPPFAGLLAFMLNTSQMIVKFYRQTSWPQPLISRMMRRDKPEKIGFAVCQRCITRKTQVEVKTKASVNEYA